MIAPLEEANRLQKEFVLFAGHELKTPVTVMKASLDMLEREGIHSKYLDLKEGDEVVECDLIIIEESLLIRTPHVSRRGISFR